MLMLKHTLTAAALGAALATPAFAQMSKPDAAPSSMPSAAQHENFVQNQHATDWRSSKLIGASVYGPDNASIGEVNDVLISNDGKIRAVVIGVGGFLGVGEKNVAVPLDSLSIARKADSSSIDKITVKYSKDELKNAPKFAYYDPAKSETTGSNVSPSAVSPMSGSKQ